MTQTAQNSLQTPSLEALYKVKATQPEIVHVTAFNFVKIDGQGDPNTSETYRNAVEALYTVSYALKFTLKRNALLEYKVFPLEGLWWADEYEAFSTDRKGDWRWTLMIAQPPEVTQEHFVNVLEEVRRKKNPLALERLRFESFDEGLSAQVMHIGPYGEEAPTIERLHTFILEGGHRLSGLHHEIYLGDPRRAKPEKLKTVIRQPIAL